jgi:hypothetical protein
VRLCILSHQGIRGGDKTTKFTLKSSSNNKIKMLLLRRSASATELCSGVFFERENLQWFTQNPTLAREAADCEYRNH